MGISRTRTLLLLGLATLAGCAGSSPSTEPGVDSLGTFKDNGDPSAPNGAPLFVYPGDHHLATRPDATMLERVRAWYTAHGMF